jgi:predicted O-methyltransferase YrrM
LNFKFKKYWRKTGLKPKWGNKLIQLLNEKKPKHFLEIGVFCGVTSRNICEFLNLMHRGNFTYTGIDLFGNENEDNNEKKPMYINRQKFSNPLKHFYYNLIMKENLNSLESVKKFLKNFEDKVSLHKGNSNKVLKSLNIKKIDFAFIDGGHNYQTTLNDLDIVYQNMKGKKGTIVCDDYQDASYITDVKKAIDDYVKKKNLSLRIIEGKFAVIDI